MELISKGVPENWNLFCISDLHIGSSLFYLNALQKAIGMVHSEHDGCNKNLVHLGGDLIEAIAMDDKRFQLESTDKTIISQQEDYAVELLAPIRKNIVCSLQGNHEIKLWRVRNFAEKMAQSLGVPYGGYTARLSYFDKHGIQFKHFSTHGFRSISSTADDPQRRKTNMELSLKRLLKFKSQTCALATMGHTHKMLVCKPTAELYLDDDGEKLTQHYTTDIKHSCGYTHHDQRWYCNTGSMMKLYDIGSSGYAERAGYDPIELGFVIVKVRNRAIQDIDKVVL